MRPEVYAYDASHVFTTHSGKCSISATSRRRKFTGQIHDQESLNDYFGARYYAEYTGRFMSPDWALVPTPVPFATLDNPQSLNLYGYMRNNPLSGRDKDGHHQECTPDHPFTDSNGNFGVQAGGCQEVSDGPWWLAFNPWGKLGGPAHRHTVQKLSETLRSEGYDVETEVKVPTPTGAKQTRYIDVVGVKKETGETKMYQVGDRNKDGQPVPREKSALDDIEQATGVRPQFEDKSLGSELENIEMGLTPSSITTEGAAEGDAVGEPESPIEIPPL